MLLKLAARVSLALTLSAAVAMTGACKKDDESKPKKQPKPTPKPSAVDAAVTKPNPKPVTLSSEQIVKHLDGVAAAMNPLDPTKLGGLYTDSANYVVRNSPKAVSGNGKIAGYYRDFMAAFPDMRVDQLLVLVNAQRAVVVSRSQGTNSKAMMGIKATNKKVSFLGFEHVDFADGRIDRVEAYADNLSYLGQLGVYKGPHRKFKAAKAAERVVAVAKGDDKERENLALATKLKDYFNAKDMAAHASMYTRDATLHDATLAADVKGRKPIRGAIGAFRKAFPDAAISDFRAFAAGDYVTATYRVTATHNGRYDRLKLNKTGKRIELDVAMVLHIANGKIARHWSFADAAALAAQLGALKVKY